MHTVSVLKCSIWPIDMTQSKWTWEQWQWKSTPHSPELQDWSLIIRLFSVIFRTLVGCCCGGTSFLQRCSQYILLPQLTGLKNDLKKKKSKVREILKETNLAEERQAMKVSNKLDLLILTACQTHLGLFIPRG